MLILLSTEPQRILETILSRCLRLNFSTESSYEPDEAQSEWLARFGALAAGEQKSLLGRYRLLDVLLQKLGEIRARVDEALTARSPLQRYDDVEKDLRERWEDELTAAIEAEYRRQRADLLLLVQWWLRDVWLPHAGGWRGIVEFPANGRCGSRRQKNLAAAGPGKSANPGTDATSVAHQRPGSAGAGSGSAEAPPLNRERRHPAGQFFQSQYAGKMPALPGLSASPGLRGFSKNVSAAGVSRRKSNKGNQYRRELTSAGVTATRFMVLFQQPGLS